MEADYCVVIHLHVTADDEYKAREIGEDVCKFIYAYKEVDGTVERVKID